VLQRKRKEKQLEKEKEKEVNFLMRTNPFAFLLSSKKREGIMKYHTGDIELSINDEEMLKMEIDRRAVTFSEGSKFYFEKVLEGYKNYDFSYLAEFDEERDIDKIRNIFRDDSELAQRPLLFMMYAFKRNGFLDDYFHNKSKVIDILGAKALIDLPNDIPEGIITEDGKFYGVGRDGHIWLYNFLNLSGIKTSDCLRYSNFVDPDTKYRNQYFSCLKEFHGVGKALYLTEQQAIVLNNLRKKYDYKTPLQSFLLNHTADLGFRAGDSSIALKINFDTFAKAFPEEPLDRSEMFHAKKAADIMRQGYDSLDATLTKKSDDDRAK